MGSVAQHVQWEKKASAVEMQRKKKENGCEAFSYVIQLCKFNSICLRQIWQVPMFRKGDFSWERYTRNY